MKVSPSRSSTARNASTSAIQLRCWPESGIGRQRVGHPRLRGALGDSAIGRPAASCERPSAEAASSGGYESESGRCVAYGSKRS